MSDLDPAAPPTGASILNRALLEVASPDPAPAGGAPGSDPGGAPPTPAPEGGTPPAGDQPDPAGTPPEAPAPEGTPDPPEGQQVPYERFKAVNDELKAQRERVAEFERQQEQARLAQLTEQEQAEERARKAEAEAQAARERAEKLERDSWILGMASALGFADPQDAVALVDPAACTDQAAAQEAVKQLASQKPHLLGKPGTARPMGTPGGGHQPAAGAGGTPGGDPGDERQQTGKDLLNFLTRGRA